MRAIILAAGQGRRLLPLTADRPKCCLDVGGTTPIEFLRDALHGCGVSDLVVVVGYHGDAVRQRLGRAVTYVENPDYATTNSLESLRLAQEAAEDGALVFNADVLVKPETLERLVNSPVANALLFERRECFEEEEMKLAHDSAGRLLSISKTLHSDDAMGENLGLLKLSRATMRAVLEFAELRASQGDLNAWVPAALDAIAGRHPIHCIEIGGAPWIEMDFPEDLARARTEVMPRIQGERVEVARS